MDWWEIMLSFLLIVVGGGGIINLIIKARLDELHAMEERLRDERRKIYSAIFYSLLVYFYYVFIFFIL